MKKIGLLGGTYNPVHLGHLILASSVLEQLNLDKIIFIPCNIPAIKERNNLASPADRLAMLKLAIKGNKAFAVSDIELKRKGVSYTIDTLRQLRKNNISYYFIIGEDNIKDFKRWKEPLEILKLVRLVVTNRGGYNRKIPQYMFGKKIYTCSIPDIQISSSEIRKRLAKNLDVKYYVPDDVYRYLKEKKLYKRT